MAKFTIECTWRSVHEVEMIDDMEDEDFSLLDSFPDDVLEELTPFNAELVDWEVSKKE